MSAEDIISNDEIILKRILPGKDNIKAMGSSKIRATKFGIQPRTNENFPSWSRRKITSEDRLLEIVGQVRDISGWSVAAVSVSSVRRLGLDVVASPTNEDHGHCEIVPTSHQPFTNKIWSKLAKETTIIYPILKDSD